MKPSVRAESLWIFHVGLSCCSLEVEAAAGPRFDWERFGCHLVDDPKNADVLIVSGPVVDSLGPSLRRIYEEMRGPRLVIAAGVCASTGGMFSSTDGSGVKGLDRFVPVDLFVPGCPPRPESIIHAILHMQDKITRGKAG